MDIDFIVANVVSQVGEDKAKEVLGFLTNLVNKVGDNTIIIKRVGSRGVCALITDGKKSTIDAVRFHEKPKLFEIESKIKEIEI